ncbi:MAG: hypothetical protein ABIK28_25320 [Planctomycetota bacterium]
MDHSRGMGMRQGISHLGYLSGGFPFVADREGFNASKRFQLR